MRLLAKSNHKKGGRKWPSEVLLINRDGWVVTRDGAMGDNGRHADCTLSVDIPLREIRQAAGLSQLEMACIIGVSRATYIAIEKNPSQLSLVQFLALKKTVELSALLPRP